LREALIQHERNNLIIRVTPSGISYKFQQKKEGSSKGASEGGCSVTFAVLLYKMHEVQGVGYNSPERTGEKRLLP
jgi:hypothetical protein